MMRRETFRSRLLTMTLVAVCIWAASAPTSAAVLTYDETDPAGNPTPSTGTHRGDGPFTIGYLFEVGATPITINRLGIQDVDDLDETRDPDPPDNGTNLGFADDDGFVSSPLSVGIWNAAGTGAALATATVTSTDPVIDSWRYATLTTGGPTFTLAANTSYLIGAFVGSSREYFLDEFGDTTSAFQQDAGITVRQSRFLSSVFGAPTSVGGALNEASTRLRWGAANAIFAAPEIAVSGNAVNIVDGDTSPSLADFTDFGVTTLGNAIQRTFRVDNFGNLALTTSGLIAPLGFSIVEGLSASIAAGGFDTFTIQLDAAAVGLYTWDISITNGDSDENPFNFRVQGIVIPAPAALPAGLGLIGLIAARRRNHT